MVCSKSADQLASPLKYLSTTAAGDAAAGDAAAGIAAQIAASKIRLAAETVRLHAAS